MNTATIVDNSIMKWKADGVAEADLVVAIAKSCMGWPYVFGARGQLCTPANRRARIRSDHPTIYTKCQVLTGPKNSCSGCKFYPGGATRFFDCRGFTYWVFLQAGHKINGAGATSQYNDDENWSEKGPIANMPRDMVCCVFKDVKGTKEHTGIHIGNGEIIHCSNGVQKGKVTDKGWTHYAIVKGFDGKLKEGGIGLEIPGGNSNSGEAGKTEKATGNSGAGTASYPTIRKGSKGDAVVICQRALIEAGYSVGPDGADGVFGKNTELGVREFQRDAGVTIDGIVGPKTWFALKVAAPAVVEGSSESQDFGKHASTDMNQFFTVMIPHLTEAEADTLVRKYPEAKKTQEGGET